MFGDSGMVSSMSKWRCDLLLAMAVLLVAIPRADAAPATGTGTDFIADARLLYRVAACGGIEPLPASIDPRVVARHCANIGKRMATFRRRYFVDAQPFFASLRPASLPTTVVYPFGGGDLLSALVAFPDATEITTISLELAGDPRRIGTLSGGQLEGSLGSLRTDIGGLLSVGSNTSLNLSSGQRNDLPAQVSSFLLGLAAAGFEPVAMRFFQVADDGHLVYLDAAAIAAIEASSAGKRGDARKASWHSPSFSEAFANVEIQYRRPGETQLRVHRHIAWNLADDYLRDHPGLLAHLAAKGQVTMLTKGASFLLWFDTFSMIRGYLLDHLAWMLSDATGIPPRFARAAGMVQDTYGAFTGPFLSGARGRDARDFVALWRKNPYHGLGFRFGYNDAAHHAHLVVTRPAR